MLSLFDHFANQILSRSKLEKKKMMTKMKPVFVFFCVCAASQDLVCLVVALVKVQIQGSTKIQGAKVEAPDIR